MEQLIDGDLASNNGGWQWSASTGTDPQPYFRIFNPASQSEKVAQINLEGSCLLTPLHLGRSVWKLHQTLCPRTQ